MKKDARRAGRKFHSTVNLEDRRMQETFAAINSTEHRGQSGPVTVRQLTYEERVARGWVVEK